jgi:hypothetical protein
MGRVGMEGQPVNHHHTYTPLDLFNYSPNSNNANTLELSAKGGYFSSNGGQNDLGTFNDAALYGGDIADWASPQSGTQGLTPGNYDAFNAFAGPDQVGQVTTSDIRELTALGYHPTGIV